MDEGGDGGTDDEMGQGAQSDAVLFMSVSARTGRITLSSLPRRCLRVCSAFFFDCFCSDPVTEWLRKYERCMSEPSLAVGVVETAELDVAMTRIALLAESLGLQYTLLLPAFCTCWPALSHLSD